MAKTTSQLAIDDRSVRVSSLEKVMYPSGFTKAGIIDYYIRIAEVMVPHLRERPITLKRYPDGTQAGHFFEKQCPSHKPEWVETATAQYKEGGKRVNHCLINERAALIWAANLGSIELHTSLAKADDIHRPTMMAFDLDPGPQADMLDCLDVAVKLRELLEDLKLRSYPKTSGGKGLHLYVPLNTPVTYEQTKPLANALAEMLAERQPDRVTAVMAKKERTGKVFIDWSQNTLHKTTVCAYSLRAKERPTVSTPITWDEVEAARKKKAPERLVFEAADVLKRAEKHGDLFAEVLTLKQKFSRAAATAAKAEITKGAKNTKSTKKTEKLKKAGKTE